MFVYFIFVIFANVNVTADNFVDDDSKESSRYINCVVTLLPTRSLRDVRDI